MTRRTQDAPTRQALLTPALQAEIAESAKAEVGALWCRHASDHARKIGTKPWKYLLIPHDLVTEDKRLVDFLSFEGAAPVAPHNAMTTRSDGAR